MEIIRGRAERLGHGTRVRYGERAATVINETIFTVDAATAVMKSANAIVIETGDSVLVVGEKSRDGLFRAYAVNNLSRGVVSHCGSIAPLIVGIVFVVLGVPFILFMGLGLIFVGVGVWLLADAGKMAKARRMAVAGDACRSGSTPG